MSKRKKVCLLSLAAVTAVLVPWMVWGNITVGTTRYTVASSRLPAAFDHYRMVVVSDFHNAEYGDHNRQLVRQIAAEQPDSIVFTGDLLDSRQPNLDIVEDLIRELTAIAPCYYVTGNHETRLVDQFPLLEQMLLAHSVVVLHDEAVPLTRNGEIIQLVGLDDPDFTDRNASIQQSMLETKLRNLDLTADYRILLSHRPECFDAYVAAEMDLVLSGHAHGGQFRLPLVGGLIAPNQGFFPKYDGGVYTEQGTTMIVSRGVGNSILPVRFNNRPELVSVELVHAE